MKWMGEWYEEKSQMLVIDNIHLFISTSGPPPLDDMTDYIASLNLNKTEYKPVPVEQVHTWQLGGHGPPLVSTLFPTHNKCVCNQPTYTDLCCMCFPEGYPKIAVLHQIFWIAFWPDTVIMKFINIIFHFRKSMFLYTKLQRFQRNPWSNQQRRSTRKATEAWRKGFCSVIWYTY